MSDTTIPHVVATQAECHPDREAVVDGELRLSYAQLEAQIRRVCRAAMCSGIAPGELLVRSPR